MFVAQKLLNGAETIKNRSIGEDIYYRGGNRKAK